MTEKSDPRAKLLAETFHENWNDGPIALLARQAAAHARERRRMRRGFLALGTTIAAFAMLLLLARNLRTAPTRLTVEQPKPSAAYEIISDAELLEQLRDRPLLIVQNENGSRDLIFLDH